eukprot:jgi/Botrbrau1/5464/Bobra.27_1s0015.1
MQTLVGVLGMGPKCICIWHCSPALVKQVAIKGNTPCHVGRALEPGINLITFSCFPLYG